MTMVNSGLKGLTRNVDQMLVQCWPAVVDGGPTLKPNLISVSRFYWVIAVYIFRVGFGIMGITGACVTCVRVTLDTATFLLSIFFIKN